MGIICASSSSNLQNKASSVIDKQLVKDLKAMKKVIKMLLLGASESGKSTILKQMKILHANGFSQTEVIWRRGIIYSNIVTALLDILEAMPKLGIELENRERVSDGQCLFDLVTNMKDDEPFTEETSRCVKTLWADCGVQKCYEQRNRFQFSDNAEYFFDSLERICEPDFVPTEQDILHTRIQTTGVIQVDFQIKGKDFNVFDVGGQRSERRKWIHIFDNVDAVIFLTSLSEYDQVLREDDTTNRMVESLDLFQSICNSAHFKDVSMILFLNKTDLFMEKLPLSPLALTFPEYHGPNTYTECVTFICRKFTRLNRNAKKEIYTHETCATDTGQVEFVLDSVIDICLTKALGAMGVE